VFLQRRHSTALHLTELTRGTHDAYVHLRMNKLGMRHNVEWSDRPRVHAEKLPSAGQVVSSVQYRLRVDHTYSVRYSRILPSTEDARGVQHHTDCVGSQGAGSR